MKKISLILIFILTFLFVDAARMYHGNSTYISDCEYTYSNGKVYRGNSTYIYDIMFTYYNNNIYNRNSTYSSDIICKYINGKCYKGNSTYISDVLWTYHNNRIYKGNSTYISDCILTVANNHVYRGNSTYSSDIIMTYEGYIPMSVLIICAMNLCRLSCFISYIFCYGILFKILHLIHNFVEYFRTILRRITILNQTYLYFKF